jgi:hypothetical protein
MCVILVSDQIPMRTINRPRIYHHSKWVKYRAQCSREYIHVPTHGMYVSRACAFPLCVGSRFQVFFFFFFFFFASFLLWKFKFRCTYIGRVLNGTQVREIRYCYVLPVCRWIVVILRVEDSYMWYGALSILHAVRTWN